MNTFTKIAGGALAAILITTAFAQAGNYTVVDTDRGISQLARVVGCKLASGDFPDDLYVINKGAKVIKAGTQINWSLPEAYAQGVHTLVADLAAGQSAFVSNAIPGGVESNNVCKARL